MGRPSASTLLRRAGHAPQRSAPAPRSMGIAAAFPQIPAVKGNAQQFALQHDARIVQHQIERQRVPHAHMLGRHQHAALRHVPITRSPMPAKTRRPHRVARAQSRAIQTVALRGTASSGRKMIAITRVEQQEPDHEQGRAQNGSCPRHAGGDEAGQIFHVFPVQQQDRCADAATSRQDRCGPVPPDRASASRPAWRRRIRAARAACDSAPSPGSGCGNHGSRAQLAASCALPRVSSAA